MKVLLTGGTGFLGSRVQRYLRQGYEVGTLPSALLRGELTAARMERLAEAVAAEKADVLFHAAAISDTGYAQQHPEESYRANVCLPQTLAGIAAKLRCKFVFCSSDQVYGGCAGKGPFAEDMPLKPVNVYGRHKLEAEALVAEAAPGAVSLRLTWMYDLPACRLPSHRDLLLQMLLAAVRREPLPLSATDYRGVTYVGQVLENLPMAFALPGGVYNFGSGSDQNIFQIAVAWRGELGLDGLEIQPVDGNLRSLCMDMGKTKAVGIAFDETIFGIRRCISDYGLDKL
ncbi:MAG TPA: sugar nucleotide-binding protein [Candidatus Limiplasma sp.]|nr:sugar nucleotide-binding protein [Candidatus Limiplasma sp.]